MKKTFLLLFFATSFAFAQAEKDRVFNFGPMVRINGIVPFNFGDNYLNDSDSKVSFGIGLSPFEVYRFRLHVGVDHLFYKTKNIEMAADVTRTKNTSVYGLISYRAPLSKNLSFEPYFGGGWSGLSFKRPENDLFDQYDLDEQDGAEFRLGFFLDYTVDPMASAFIGAAYVLDSYSVDTVPEYNEYFSEAQAFHISLGLKFGYTMNDKRRTRAAAQNQ